MRSPPVIDFTPFCKDEGVIVGKPPTPEQLEVAIEIDKANRELGFLCIQNFGLERVYVNKCFELSKKLFDLPTETKENKLKPIDENEFGYVSPRMNEVKEMNAIQAFKEAFKIRDGSYSDYSFCPNGFQEMCESLFESIQEVKKRYNMAISLALGLDPHFLSEMHDELDLCCIRFNHYAPCEFNVKKPIVRLGAHTDFGTHTFLLLEDGAHGLEIQPRGTTEVDEWTQLTIPEDVFCLVNIGDMMQTLSNGRWKATRHRVMVSNEDQSTKNRYSIACFCNPKAKQYISPIPDLVRKDGITKYKGFVAGEYFKSQIKKIVNSAYVMEAKEEE